MSLNCWGVPGTFGSVDKEVRDKNRRGRKELIGGWCIIFLASSVHITAGRVRIIKHPVPNLRILMTTVFLSKNDNHINS